MEEKKKQVKTQDNKVTITSQRAAPFYVFVGKRALSNFETIELHALGMAMSTCVSAADLLTRYWSVKQDINDRFGYATLKKTIVEQVEVQGQVGMVKRPKMRIVLTRAANFKDLIAKADAVKKENEAAFNAINPPTNPPANTPAK